MFRVPLFDDESLTSYCSRLAAANVKAAPDFCLDLGFRFREVVNGSELAVRKLSMHGDIAPERLRRTAIVKAGTSWKLGPETFTAARYARTRIRVCPICLDKDDRSSERMPGTRRYMRRTWPLRFIRTCLHCQCAIVDLGVSPLGSPRCHDFIDGLDALHDEIEKSMSSPIARSLSEFENFVHQRLHGIKTHGDILDNLPLELAGYLCELIGAADLFGRNADISSLDDQTLWSASQCGYSHLVFGTAGLHAYLDRMHLSLETVRSDFGGRKIYGKFYEILSTRKNPEWNPLKETIHDYAFNVLPLSEKANVFGTSPNPKYLSHTEIQRQFGINPLHLRKMAVVAGLLDPSSLRSGSVPKAVAQKIVEAIDDALLPMEAAALLGVSYSTFRRLKQDGLFQPSLASGNGAAARDRFSRRSLARFIDAVKPQCPCPLNKNLKSIRATALHLGCKQSEIILLLQSRTLKSVAWDDAQVGLAAPMIDPAEVSAFVTLPDHGHMSLGALAKCWRMSGDTVTALANGGYLTTVLDKNVRRRKIQRFVTKADAAAFREKYVSFLGARTDFGITRTKLRSILDKFNFAPVFPVAEVHSQFYLREELEAAIIADRCGSD